MDELESLAEHWKIIGVQIGVPDTILSTIEGENSTDYDRLKAAVRFCLYRCPFASWRSFLLGLDMMCDTHEDCQEKIDTVYLKMKDNAEEVRGV